MNKSCGTVLLFGLLVAVLSWPSMGHAQADSKMNSCAICHDDMNEQFDGSVHEKARVACVDCHGGDSSSEDEEVAMDPAKGFKRFARKDIPAMCASCHADKNRMKQYGIPSDQYELYLTSRHGKALAEKGDSKVAVCTDCHSSRNEDNEVMPHAILKSGDAASPVYDDNVPATCARCHSDRERMEPYGLKADVFDQYKRGVHGKALLIKGDRGAPECSDCHGKHGAAPPGVTEVANVCGQCHVSEKENFQISLHKSAMDKSMMKECISCHQQHQTGRATLDAYDTICVKCHVKSTEPFKHGRQIKNLLVSARESFDHALERLEEADEEGFDTAELRGQLENARTDIIQSSPTQHSLSIEKIEELSSDAEAITGEVISSVDYFFSRLKLRKVGLLIFLLFMLGFISALVAKRQRLKKQMGY